VAKATQRVGFVTGGDHPNAWAKSNSTYIAGRAYLDGADETAAEMEAKWGVDRLRLLVDAPWREKFDRQRYLLNRAIWHGELEQVRLQANRMVNAWLKLNELATAAGWQPLGKQIWEVGLADGSVAAIVPDDTTGSRGHQRRATGCGLHAGGNRAVAVRLPRHRKSQAGVSWRDRYRRAQVG
jgi:hypothetical protein